MSDRSGGGVSAIEAATMARVSRRLIPFLILCYFIAYVDRVNVGFAALTMNKDLGLSAAAFGVGGGLFFVAYVLFEVPSNVRWSGSARGAGSPASWSPGGWSASAPPS